MSDLTINRGDTENLDATLLLPTELPETFANISTFVFTLYWPTVGTLAGTPLITKSVANGGIVVTDSANGKYTVHFAASDFNSLVATSDRLKEFIYKIVATNNSGETRTVTRGKLTVRNNY